VPGHSGSLASCGKTYLQSKLHSHITWLHTWTHAIMWQLRCPHSWCHTPVPTTRDLAQGLAGVRDKYSQCTAKILPLNKPTVVHKHSKISSSHKPWGYGSLQQWPIIIIFILQSHQTWFGDSIP
jgi:hypothetical protein